MLNPYRCSLNIQGSWNMLGTEVLVFEVFGSESVNQNAEKHGFILI